MTSQPGRLSILGDALKVSVSEDRMSAFIRLPHDRDVTMQDLRDGLLSEGVKAGISPVALRGAITGPRGVFYQIAWGKKPASAGEPGAPVVMCKFPDSQGPPAGIMEAAPGFRKAWKQLRDRGAVSAGDVLAFVRNVDKYPKALTVTGDQVACVEFPASIKPGKNAKLSRDGTAIISTRPGIPYQDADGVCVMDHVEVIGDVDSATGDISFPGDLSIKGDVQAGFRASATGDILISGNLWGSATARGRIVVSGGVNAPGEVVESGGGVTCRFCENSLVRSAGVVTVIEAVIHSVVETDASLETVGEKGKIVGGLVRAAKGVSATIAGTPMGIPTVIEVGVSPKMRHEQARMERELEKVRADLEEAERTGGKRLQAEGNYDALRLLRMRRLWEDQEALLTRRLESFNETLSRLPKGYFEARHVLPGVRLVMGADVMEFTSPIDRVSKGAVPREAD